MAVPADAVVAATGRKFAAVCRSRRAGEGAGPLLVAVVVAVAPRAAVAAVAALLAGAVDAVVAGEAMASPRCARQATGGLK